MFRHFANKFLTLKNCNEIDNKDVTYITTIFEIENLSNFLYMVLPEKMFHRGYQ